MMIRDSGLLFMGHPVYRTVSREGAHPRP